MPRIICLLFLALLAAASARAAQVYPQTYVLLPSAQMAAFDFSFDGADGQPIALSQFRGHVLLIVNTASGSRRAGQVAYLQYLQDTYGEQGLVVVAVPSGDFGAEPLEGAALLERYRGKYMAQYPIAAKTPVSGDAAHPFYQWAAAQPRRGFQAGMPRGDFHKLLVGRDGTLLNSYDGGVSPADIVLLQDIEEALAKKKG